MSKITADQLITILRNHDVLREKVYNGPLYVRERLHLSLSCINEVTYSRPFDDKWTNTELLCAIVELNCRGSWLSRLTNLPGLPNYRVFDCSANALTSLPCLDVCDILDCSLNKLTSLGPLPNCTHIMADDNDIREIGLLPSCDDLLPV